MKDNDFKKITGVRQRVRERFNATEKLRRLYACHIPIVDDYSMQLTARHGGDEQVVLLGSALHDIGWLADETGREHDTKGVPLARKILNEFGYREETIIKIERIILTHSCKAALMPETLEEKIVATADGMSQFRPDFVRWSIWSYNRPGMTETAKIQNVTERIKEVFFRKILLPREKEVITSDYKRFLADCEILLREH